MIIFISGTAGTSPFSWPCCQKTEGAKLSQGDQNGFADGRWSIEASPLPLLPSPCFVPGGGNPCLHPGHPLLGTSPRRRSGWLNPEWWKRNRRRCKANVFTGWRFLVPGYRRLHCFCLHCFRCENPGHFKTLNVNVIKAIEIFYLMLMLCDNIHLSPNRSQSQQGSLLNVSVPFPFSLQSHQTRTHLKLGGSPLADFILSFTLWPRLNVSYWSQG